MIRRKERKEKILVKKKKTEGENMRKGWAIL